MNIESMDTPRTRAEFERNLHLLQRQFVDNKFFLPRDATELIDGIARVRYLPNGRIDFLSIDAHARLQAKMANQMSNESSGEQLNEQQDQTVPSAEE